MSARVLLVGFHSWPHAPHHRDYLKNLHRHLFHVEAEVVVDHADRDVEFHDLQGLIRGWWGDENSKKDRGSCEVMCVGLADQLQQGGIRVIRVAVGEDGEAWATWRLDGNSARVPHQQDVPLLSSAPTEHAAT